MVAGMILHTYAVEIGILGLKECFWLLQGSCACFVSCKMCQVQYSTIFTRKDLLLREAVMTYIKIGVLYVAICTSVHANFGYVR